MEYTFDLGPLAQVSCENRDTDPVLVFERTLPHSAGRIWKALVDPQEQKGWAPFIAEKPLEDEGPNNLRMNGDESGELFPCTVNAARAPRLVEFTWGDDVLHWSLEPAPGGTTLTLRHTVSALEWIPKVAAGWHLCITVMSDRLHGHDIGPLVGERAMDYGWAGLHDAYAHELEIE